MASWQTFFFLVSVWIENQTNIPTHTAITGMKFDSIMQWGVFDCVCYASTFSVGKLIESERKKAPQLCCWSIYVIKRDELLSLTPFINTITSKCLFKYQNDNENWTANAIRMQSSPHQSQPLNGHFSSLWIVSNLWLAAVCSNWIGDNWTISQMQKYIDWNFEIQTFSKNFHRIPTESMCHYLTTVFS